jgi:hypothetical protein
MHEVTMTTVQITLPDQLAREAQSAGLLASEVIERLLRDHLRSARLERLDQARERLAQEPLAPLTADEIQAEIDAYRAEWRAAAGS